MQHKPRVSLDSAEMRGRVRGYNPRPISDFTYVPRTQTNTRAATPQLAAATRPNIQKVAPMAIAPQQRAANLPKPNTISQKPPQPAVIGKKRLAPKKVKGYALVAAAFAMLATGAFLAFQGYSSNKEVIAQSKSMAENAIENRATDSNLDETKPSDIGSYKVAPDLPRYLQINKIGVFSRILPMGITGKNTVDAPKGIYDAGWYKGSSKPGQPGAMFIDGHVSGPTKNGVLYGLSKLQNGDIIAVESGDGTKHAYKVVAKEVFDADKVDMKKVLKSYDLTKPGLNIMTCNGKFDAKEQSYNKRLVVYAVGL